jgi:hypothetical protein
MWPGVPGLVHAGLTSVLKHLPQLRADRRFDWHRRRRGIESRTPDMVMSIMERVGGL